MPTATGTVAAHKPWATIAQPCLIGPGHHWMAHSPATPAAFKVTKSIETSAMTSAEDVAARAAPARESRGHAGLDPRCS